MTLSTETNTISHTGNGSVTVFAYDFRVDDEDHMQVYLDGVLQTTGYTIDGLGEASGGNVTFDTAPGTDVIVTLIRQVPYTQPVDYTPYSPFPAETHEAILDTIVMQCQQLKENIDRAIQAPIGGDPNVDYTLPEYDAGKALMWDETEKELTTTTDNIDTIATDAIAAKVAAEAAQAAAETAETNAEAAETNAEAAQALAEAAQADAEAARDLAEDWASEAEDVEVSGGKFSAYHWAQKSEEFSDRTAIEGTWSAMQQYGKTTKAASSGTVTIDLDSEASVELTMSGDVTLAVSNKEWGRGCEVKVIQSGAGNTLGFDTDFDIAGYDAANNDEDGSITIYWIWTDGTIVFIRKLWEDD